MNKKQYLYSNLFAWGLVLLLIAIYVHGWTIPSQDPPGGNIVLETGATPAGSTGYIQFNDNGNLGADSNLFWDNTNKRLGIGTTSPGAKLEVNGNIIASDPTDGSHVATKGYVDSIASSSPIELYCGGVWRSGYGTSNKRLANGVEDTLGNLYTLEADGYVYKNNVKILVDEVQYNLPTMSGRYLIVTGSGGINEPAAYCEYCKDSVLAGYGTGANISAFCYNPVAGCTCTGASGTARARIEWVKCAKDCTQIRW
ncbi:hypothetical protein KO465_10150 [Candidatus Micrarchaeota archaeon]|jgi:hypothetical protein|nr:hypothetical protein [Candidatus Micrarchaeota archaeon]